MDSGTEIGPTDPDDKEDNVASDIELELTIRNTDKTKGPKLKWSKEPREIRGWFQKKYSKWKNCTNQSSIAPLKYTTGSF